MTPKLSVLHVLQTPDGGGPAQALALARDTIARGGSVIAAAPESGGCLAEASAAGAATEVLPRRTEARATAILRLARRADIVHVHGTRAAAWSLPAIALRPSVVTFHGLHPLRRPAGVAYRRGARAFIRAVTAASDATICVSAEEARDLARHVPSARRVHIVRNAVPPMPLASEDTRRSARAALRVAPEEIVVLSLGRLDPAKDPFTSLAAAARLGEKGVVLVMAGDGPLLEAVRRQAAPNVRVVGGQQDVRKLLAAADVVLNTSLWEGLSLSLLEAMWVGRPVVASDAPGNVEAVGDAGVIVPRGDVGAIEEALVRLRDPGVRTALARAGRLHVEREFSFDTMLEETWKVYEAVLTRRKWRRFRGR